MSAGVSGVNANAFSGSTDLDAQGWTLDGESTGWDSTTTADLGWEDENSSTQKYSGSVDILYNPAKKPDGAGMGVHQGNVIALTLWVVNPGGDSYAGNARVQKLSIKAKVKEGLLVTITWTSKGPWTSPS